MSEKSNVTVDISNADTAKRNKPDMWRIVQLAMLAVFMCLFYALFAAPISSGGLLGNGYYIFEARDASDIVSDIASSIAGALLGDGNMTNALLGSMAVELYPILLTAFILNAVIIIRIALMIILPLFSSHGERRWGRIFYGVPIAEYAANVILAIGLMVKLSMWGLTVGVMPILLLVFSVLFLNASILTVVLQAISKKYNRHDSESDCAVVNEEAAHNARKREGRLTVEAFIWIFDALFVIAAIVILIV